MDQQTYLSTALEGAPALLLSGIQITVLLLPLLVAITAGLRLRQPNPPKAAWFCIGATVLLYLLWLIPPLWLGQAQLRQLRDFAALGLFAWALFDWFRLVRDDQWILLDLFVIAVVALLLVATLAGYAIAH